MSQQHPFSLIQGRLGIYDKRPFVPTTIDGVNHTSVRLHGLNLQQERMIADKKRSLDRAVWNSYQGAEVRLLASPDGETWRALINPNRLSQDYDDKVISIDYDSGIAVGSVFQWVNTNSTWLVYLQDLTELAYFKGDVRKCSYEIEWIDKDGNSQKTYAAIKGPTQNSLKSIVTRNISIDMPNYTLSLLVPKTAETLEQFKRYTKFYLNSIEGVERICWRVAAVDSISNPGIIEIAAEEYWINKDEDDVENGIVGGKIEEEKDPNPELEGIQGESFILPKVEYEYFSADKSGEWKIISDLPVDFTVNDNVITLKWLSSFSGQFDLLYGEYKKTIIVKSLF